MLNEKSKGGSYLVDKDGKTTVIRKPTKRAGGTAKKPASPKSKPKTKIKKEA